MKLFKKKAERSDRIYVNNGSNDHRVYPIPGSLMNIKLEADDEAPVQTAEDDVPKEQWKAEG